VSAPLAVVRWTSNFESNLADVADFWRECDAPHADEHLLDKLGSVIGNLERHPRIGRRFFSRPMHSIEVRDRVEQLTRRFGTVEVREYLSGDYLLLYSLNQTSAPARPTVHLLAIRHHRQLSFDFDDFWHDNRGEDPSMDNA